MQPVNPLTIQLNPLTIEHHPLSLKVQSMVHPVIPFDYKALLTQASFEQIAKNITVPNGTADLIRCKFYHGTPISEMRKVMQGPMNLGRGYAAEGLYAFLNEPGNAIEYAHIKTQFQGTPGILEGTLNPMKPYVVGRIQITRNIHGTDLIKGIWPADWSKNQALKNFVQSHFDILEVCGAERAGLAMPSNRFAVIYQRSGPDTIRWHKAYALKNKPVPSNLFSKTLNSQRHLPGLGNHGPYPISKGVQIGLYGLKYGFKLFEIIGLLKSMKAGADEEAKKLPFTSPFDCHEARGSIRGTVRYFSNMMLHLIDPGAAFIDPELAIQAEPLTSHQKRALYQQRNRDLNNNRTTPYMDDMLEYGVVPRDLPQQSPSASALSVDRARKWRTWENNLIDFLIQRFDLIKDPHVALAEYNRYMNYMGNIQIPKEFYTWSSQQQAKWLNDLVSRSESFFIPSANREIPEQPAMMVANRQNQDLSQPADNFIPDLTVLEPTSPLLIPNGWLDPDVLSQLSLNLPWGVVLDPTTQISTLQTSVEVTPESLASLPENLEVDVPPISSNISLHRVNTPLERPTFGELSSFTRFEIGPGIGGGYGLIGTLRSGAKVSISTTGTAILTGLSVPMAPGFLTGLGTGLVYTAPIAAVFVAINLVLSRHESDVLKHLEKDSRAAKKEGQRVNSSLQNFDHFSELFQSGVIDRETFIREVNQISANIQAAGDHMGRRGRYADRHDEQGGEGFDYFFNASKLRQIDLDLKKIAEEAVVKKEVDERYTPQLRGMALQSLVKELNDLSDKRVLSLSDKYKQDALIGEIAIRGKSEDLDTLSQLDRLAGRPVAISLNPDSVANPNHITQKHFCNSDSSEKRRYERVKSWANKLNEAYSRFEKAAKEGNEEKMNTAANDVRFQLARANGKGDVNLKDYDLVNVKDPTTHNYIKTAWKYYEPYLNKIRSNVDTTLARFEVAKSGAITDQSPAIFTSDEIKGMKVQAGTEAFNDALNKLNDPSNGRKDHAFSNLYQAALLLQSQGIVDPNVLNVIEIASEHGTFTQYQAATDRLNGIKTRLSELRDKTDKMQKLSDPTQSEKSVATEDNYGDLYKSAFDIADTLIAEGLSEADIRKIIENPDEAQQVLDYIRSVQEGYPRYQSTVERLTGIQTGLTSLQEKTSKLNEPKLKREKRLELLRERKEMAEKILKEGLTEEEIGQILANKEEAKSIFMWVQSIPEEYPHFIRIDHFENDIYHRYSSPSVRFVLHVLNDQQRFHGSSFLLRGSALTLGTGNTLFPELLPAGVNWLFARGMKESATVVDSLYKNCSRAIRTNALTSLRGHIQDPKALLAKSFNKKVTAIQGANAVVQLVARGVTACVPGKIGAPVTQSAMVLNTAANAFYYANTVKKSVKYFKASKFALKAHKVGQGLLSLGTTCFDIYEFLATDASEWGTSAGFIQTVKEILPEFHGNLPEDKNYYIIKDVMLTAAAAASCVLIGGPILTGLALLQGAVTTYNACTSKYNDDVLSAILINIRYFVKNQNWEKKGASNKNLVYYLGEDLKINQTDSPVVQKAKQHAFEHQIETLAEEENWVKLIDQTEIDLNSYKFVKRNIDLFDAIDAVLKRYTALSSSGPTNLLQSLDECEKVSAHLDQQFSKLAEKYHNYIESVKSNLQKIKECFITNICVYYLTGKLDIIPMAALTQFDKLPKEKRGCLHWYFLGRVATELLGNNQSQKHPLVELQLVCFEATWEILEEKQRFGTLDKFEEGIVKCCKEALSYLKDQVKDTLSFSKETDRFTPMVKQILTENWA